MTTSTNSGDQVKQATCTPHSFLKGLYLLITGVLREMAAVLALLAGLGLLIGISNIPAIANYRMGMDDFAMASVAAFILSLGCGTLAYFMKPYRYGFMLAGLFMAMIHMLSAMITSEIAPAEMLHGDNWWKTAPALVKAAILPMYSLMILVQIAVVGGALVLAVWALVKLPKATKSAARYICQMGQDS